MTSHPSHRPVSALPARMIEDMRCAASSRRRATTTFATCGRWPPSSAGLPTRRRRRICAASSCTKTQTGMQPPSINSSVAALRFFFTATLDRPDLARRLTVVREPRRLPAVLSVEQVTFLLQAAPGAKYKAAFATAGACPSEGRGRRATRLRGGRTQSRRH
jgi:integrase/recombinase XerD